jgi:hypothetical protein
MRRYERQVSGILRQGKRVNGEGVVFGVCVDASKKERKNQFCSLDFFFFLFEKRDLGLCKWPKLRSLLLLKWLLVKRRFCAFTSLCIRDDDSLGFIIWEKQRFEG